MGKFKFDASVLIPNVESFDYQPDPKTPKVQVTFTEMAKPNFDGMIKDIFGISNWKPVERQTGDPEPEPGAIPNEVHKDFMELEEETRNAILPWLVTGSNQDKKFWDKFFKDMHYGAITGVLQLFFETNRTGMVLSAGGNLAMLSTVKRIADEEETEKKS